VNKSGIEPKVK
jgi:hypothetical protein